MEVLKKQHVSGSSVVAEGPCLFQLIIFSITVCDFQFFKFYLKVQDEF